MSSETTKLDPESAAVVKAAETHNADLEAGADVSVPTGKEETPPGKATDPMAARKAIYKKSKTLRLAEETLVAEENPSVAYLEQLVKEQSEAEEKEREGKAKDASKAEDAGEVEVKTEPKPVIDPNARVMITVNGVQSNVTQGDIDSAGGVAELQKRLSADQRFREAATLKREADQRIADAEAAEAKLREAQTAKADLDLPSPDVQGKKDEDAEAQAKAVTKAFYGGDEEAATAALVEALKSRPAPVVQPTQDVRLPEATVIQKDLKPQTIQFGQRYVSPEETAEINTAMNGEFGEVVKDASVLGIAHDHFKRLMGDPVNDARRGVDIAREAAQFAVKATKPDEDPLAARRNLKRKAPQTTTTTARHEAPKPKAPETASDIVNNMRKHRGQAPL